MKNIQQKQQLKSQSIKIFKAYLESLPILAAQAYSSSLGIAYRSNIIITITITSTKYSVASIFLSPKGGQNFLEKIEVDFALILNFFQVRYS